MIIALGAAHSRAGQPTTSATGQVMVAGDDKRAWVSRVLGVRLSRLATGAPVPAVNAIDVRVAWNDAKRAVDARLQELAHELRSYGDEQLDQVAEFGLFGLTQAAKRWA
jgi:hypothetical protein